MTCRVGIPTASLGHVSAGHSLEARLDVAQKYGFQGVEVCYDDLVAVAQQLRHSDKPSQFESEKYAAAWTIKTMCKDRGLEIICLQPFMQYEGLLDRSEHENRFQELQLWIKLARTLGTDLILIPASSLPADQIGDRDLITKDLQKAADAGREGEPHVRFAYEARCSATSIDKWEYSWDVIKAIDRPNFGMCLDAVHIAGRVFADPAVPSARIPDGETAIDLSLRRLVKLVRSERDKVFLVQIGDARPPDEPVGIGSFEYNPEETPRMVWSRKYRLFYGEHTRGGFLPMEKILDAIFNGVEYDRWVSLELFNGRMDCRDPGVPVELARRGAVSWCKLADDMGWWPRPMNGS